MKSSTKGGQFLYSQDEQDLLFLNGQAAHSEEFNFIKYLGITAVLIFLVALVLFFSSPENEHEASFSNSELVISSGY